MYLPILLTHRHRGDWLFLHYNQVLTGKGMDQLEEFTGVMIDRSFPSPNLKRSKAIKGVPDSYMRIYKELCDLAGYDDPERFSCNTKGRIILYSLAQTVWKIFKKFINYRCCFFTSYFLMECLVFGFYTFFNFDLFIKWTCILFLTHE